MNTTLAIVGRGHWGKIYLQTISSMTDVTLPEKYVLGRDYLEVLTKENSEVDGVIIASPAPTHVEVVKRLIENGYKNFLIEKPMAHNPKAAMELRKLEKSSDVKLMVGHVQLYDPAYQAMKNFAKKNLGKITKVNYFGLQSPPAGSSVLQDWGPHPISVFLDLADSKPKQISVKKAEYDNIMLSIEFENAILAIAHIGTEYPQRRREIHITGEKGELFLNAFMNPRQLLFTDLKGESKHIHFSDSTPLQMQITEFVNVIKNKKTPKTTISQGVRVVKIISQAEGSL